MRLLLVLLLVACQTEAAPPPPPCDRTCQDSVALRSVREMVKLAYNLTLQGKPVGKHDETRPCLSGTVRVFGEATSNADQGATNVTLTYVFDRCNYVQKDADPPESYTMTLTGTIEQRGVIAVQPTATTALTLTSTSLALSGTVYDPPLPIEESGCNLNVIQNGGRVSGTFCGRQAGFQF
jgi:hypothetical protein